MMRTSIAPAALAVVLACGPVTPGETTDAATSTGGVSTDAAAASTSGTTAAAPTSGDATDPGDSTGGGTTAAASTGPSDPAVCAAAGALEIKAVTATPSAGPTWDVGETVTIEATLHNPGADDFTDYPGIRVTTAAAGVTSDAPENWLFAVLAGMDGALPVTYLAGDAAVPGVVTFDVQIIALNEVCPDLARTSIDVTLAGG